MFLNAVSTNQIYLSKGDDVVVGLIEHWAGDHELGDARCGKFGQGLVYWVSMRFSRNLLLASSLCRSLSLA